MLLPVLSLDRHLADTPRDVFGGKDFSLQIPSGNSTQTTGAWVVKMRVDRIAAPLRTLTRR